MIRFATKFDNDRIKEILKDFHATNGNALSSQIHKWSSNFVDEQLSKIYAGLGFVLIGDDGFLCAIKAPCFWIPDLWILQESMWHAKTKKTAVKLMKKYIEIGNQMKAAGQIIEFHISAFAHVDLGKYGAKKVSHDWVM